MVNMGVGQQNIIHLARRDGNFLVLKVIGSLLHAAVDDNLFSAGGQVKAAPRYLVGCAQKGQLHPISSFEAIPRIVDLNLIIHELHRKWQCFDRKFYLFSQFPVMAPNGNHFLPFTLWSDFG